MRTTLLSNIPYLQWYTPITSLTILGNRFLYNNDNFPINVVEDEDDDDDDGDDDDDDDDDDDLNCGI